MTEGARLDPELRGRSGSLAIVDYKVTTDGGRQERYEEQLRVYTLAGRGEGLNIEAAYLHELKEGTRSSVDIGPAVVNTAASRVREHVGALRRAEFKPKPSAERFGPASIRRCSQATYAYFESRTSRRQALTETETPLNSKENDFAQNLANHGEAIPMKWIDSFGRAA